VTINDGLEEQEGTTIRLTDREIEVLRLILEGKSSKEAAAELCCSKRTVDFHLARIYQKLEVSNRVQAMRRVALLGLLPVIEAGGVDQQN
jgi:DNA-binding CsgD family transcriptional regulator